MKILDHNPQGLLEKDGILTQYKGELHRLGSLDELGELSKRTDNPVAFMLPFHLISSRGDEFEAQGDEKILALEVLEEVRQTRESVENVLARCQIKLDGSIEPSVPDEEFGRQVLATQEKIQAGEICQAVISRRFEGKFADYSPEVLEELYARLLKQRGQYMTILFHTPERSFVGASPERHLEIRDGKVTMNPIAGTLPKRSPDDFKDRLLEFLADKKEIDELYQVLDEELKMMAKICPKGGRIAGPSLRETGTVIHTEYLLEGENGIDGVTALKETLHAPTLVGGPLPSASRVIAQTEADSRRYYGGEIGVLYPDGSLDSAINIRTAEVKPDGSFAVQAGAGIVRDSDPQKESAETVHKANGALKAITGNAIQTEERYLDRIDHEELQSALEARNQFLSRFFLDDQSELPSVEKLKGKKILIINNEDNFAYMLGHMAQRMGCEVEVIDTFDFNLDGKTHAEADIVILGPGPGDINNIDDSRMAELAEITGLLSDLKIPTLGVCLGHQALAKHKGMDVEKKSESSQGLQKEIDLYGTPQRVGFYNSFSVQGRDYNLEECQRDEEGGIIAMRGEGFEGMQFHPESVMSQNGYDILKDALVRLVERVV